MSVFDELVDIFLSTLRSGGDRHGYRGRCSFGEVLLCCKLAGSLYLAAAFSDSRSYPLNRRSGARLRCDSKSCFLEATLSLALKCASTSSVEDLEGPLGYSGRRWECYPPTLLHLLMIMALSSACE